SAPGYMGTQPALSRPPVRPPAPFIPPATPPVPHGAGSRAQGTTRTPAPAGKATDGVGIIPAS
ncbi:hypothetical protein LDL28_14170, partial [Komagataeibacter sp. FNDCR2]